MEQRKITIDGTAYSVGRTLTPVVDRAGRPIERQELIGPSGGWLELMTYHDGSWRLVESTGRLRAKGPRAGVVENARPDPNAARRVDAAALALWLGHAQAAVDADYAASGYRNNDDGPRLSIAPGGRRYAKVVAHDRDGRRERVHAFIDLITGDVLRAEGWRKPAPGARGNIFDPDAGVRWLRWTGVAYLDEIRGKAS
jgi:hypothetical protein